MILDERNRANKSTKDSVHVRIIRPWKNSHDNEKQKNGERYVEKGRN